VPGNRHVAVTDIDIISIYFHDTVNAPVINNIEIPDYQSIGDARVRFNLILIQSPAYK